MQVSEFTGDPLDAARISAFAAAVHAAETEYSQATGDSFGVLGSGISLSEDSDLSGRPLVLVDADEYAIEVGHFRSISDLPGLVDSLFEHPRGCGRSSGRHSQEARSASTRFVRTSTNASDLQEPFGQRSLAGSWPSENSGSVIR